MEAKTGVGRQLDPGDLSERAAIIPQNLVSGGDVTQRPTSADMRRPSSRVQSGELQRFGGPWPPPRGGRSWSCGTGSPQPRCRISPDAAGGDAGGGGLLLIAAPAAPPSDASTVRLLPPATAAARPEPPRHDSRADPSKSADAGSPG